MLPWKVFAALLFALLVSTNLYHLRNADLSQTGAAEERESAASFSGDQWIYFEPLEARQKTDAGVPSDELIELGRMLFYDPRLSRNHDISCNSCHPLDTFGTDNKEVSPGHRGELGIRNTPTVYNAGGAIAQFWDGRAADLEEQATGPILNPVEMAMASELEVVTVLRSMPGYHRAFARAFPAAFEPITLANVGVAIAAFERGLTTPGRFDRFLRGDRSALTDVEKRGLRLFMDLGCSTCHNGPAVGGGSFQRVGLVVPYEIGNDKGRFGVTHNPADKGVFKVPSLRNVAETGPYFHDGRYNRLEYAVSTMGRHQLGKVLSVGEVQTLVAFLGSLTGDIPNDYIRRPSLPESSRATPAPRTN